MLDLDYSFKERYKWLLDSKQIRLRIFHYFFGWHAVDGSIISWKRMMVGEKAIRRGLKAQKRAWQRQKLEWFVRDLLGV